MEGCKIKYDNITKIFNFIDITDKYILLKDREKTKKVYIYEVEPVTFLNFSLDIQSNILNLYSEFLRELNFDFQIFISNKRINVDKYINNLKNSINKSGSKHYIKLKDEYLASIARELENQDIYTTKFYIVISFPRDKDIDIASLDTIVRKLDSIGCKTKRIVSKVKLKSLLYECINKDVVV